MSKVDAKKLKTSKQGSKDSKDSKDTKKKTPTKEEKSKYAPEEKKEKKIKEEKSKNVPEEDGKKKKKSVDKKSDDKKKSIDKKTKKSTDKSADPKTSLSNKKKWCKAFFVESLNAKDLMKSFVAISDPKKITPGAVAEVMKAHDDKCRYSDILCLDATRVVLKDRPAGKDFIHANWMTMPDKYRYISAQGPMDESMEDFWHMVYTEKCPAIVMICDWFEEGVLKCARYIPKEEEKSMMCGMYQVTRKDEVTVPFDDVALQTLEISIPNKPDAPTHTIKHYHYHNWRDHKAPLTSSSVLKLHKILRDSPSKEPPVIHCSAGIGRTATFIGVDYGTQRIGQTGELPVLDLVKEMRQMRDKAVQSHHQFIFMIICMADLMVSQGVPRTDDMTYLSDFYQEFQEMLRKKKEAEKEEKEKNKKEKKEKEEKEKKEKEEKEKKEKEEKEKEGKEGDTQPSTCSTTQDTV